MAIRRSATRSRQASLRHRDYPSLRLTMRKPYDRGIMKTPIDYKCEAQSSVLEDCLEADDRVFLAQLSCVRPTGKGSIRAVRQEYFNRVRDRLGASEWMWAHSFVRLGEPRPRNLDFQTGRRLALGPGMAHARRAFGQPRIAVENVELLELVVAGHHFTRSNFDLGPLRYWATDPDVRRYVAKCEMDDVIYSVRPYLLDDGAVYFSGFAVGHRWIPEGVRRFSLRDQAVVHAAIAQADWLVSQGLRRTIARHLWAASASQLLWFAVSLSQERRGELVAFSKTTAKRRMRDIRAGLSRFLGRKIHNDGAARDAVHGERDEDGCS